MILSNSDEKKLLLDLKGFYNRVLIAYFLIKARPYWATKYDLMLCAF